MFLWSLSQNIDAMSLPEKSCMSWGRSLRPSAGTSVQRWSSSTAKTTLCTCWSTPPPSVSVSSLVNSLKGVSSRMIRKKSFPDIRKKLWGGHLWSPSYFAGSCGGAPISVIRQYIEQQKTPIKSHYRDGSAVRAILPRPEGRDLPRDWINSPDIMILPVLLFPSKKTVRGQSTERTPWRVQEGCRCEGSSRCLFQSDRAEFASRGESRSFLRSRHSLS